MGKRDKLLEGSKPHLESGEQVRASVLGTYETKKMGQDWTRTGILIATEQRVVFYAKKLGGYDLESFPYRNISSIEMGKGMLGHHIKLFASGNEVRMKWIKEGAIEEFVAEVRARMGSTFPTASATGSADEIRKLAELRNEGILTNEEFEAKKRELLGPN